MNLHIEKITEGGKKYVRLPEAEFKHLMEALEDAQDLRAIEDRHAEESFPADFVHALLKADGGEKLMLWRKHRDMTQKELAGHIGCTAQMVTMVERGTRKGDMAFFKAAAQALACDMDDLA